MKKFLPILLLVALSSQQAPSPARPSFVAGETLDYHLSWMKMSGGTARMTVGPIDEGRLRMTFVGKSGSFFSRIFKVRDEIESVVRRDNFSTLSYSKRLDERGRKKDESTIVDETAHTATRKGKTFAVPPVFVDPLSLMYLIRTLDLSPGAHHEFTVMADGKVYQVLTSVIRRETIRTEAGTFKTVLVEPKMHSGGVFGDEEAKLLLWYSDDERRLPVRIRSEVNVGAITASLAAVTPGVGSIEPPSVKGQ
jgi:hypothetical protein